MNTELISAGIRFVAPLIVTAAAYFGYTIDVNVVVMALMVLVAVGAFIYCWYWKNNNITKAAQETQQMLNILKADLTDRREEEDRTEEGEE